MKWLETRDGDLLNVSMISRLYIDQFDEYDYVEERRIDRECWDVNATVESDDYVVRRFESEEEAKDCLRGIYNSFSARYVS